MESEVEKHDLKLKVIKGSYQLQCLAWPLRLNTINGIHNDPQHNLRQPFRERKLFLINHEFEFEVRWSQTVFSKASNDLRKMHRSRTECLRKSLFWSMILKRHQCTLKICFFFHLTLNRYNTSRGSPSSHTFQIRQFSCVLMFLMATVPRDILIILLSSTLVWGTALHTLSGLMRPEWKRFCMKTIGQLNRKHAQRWLTELPIVCGRYNTNRHPNQKWVKEEEIWVQ